MTINISGFLAAISMFYRLKGEEIPDFTNKTAIGALGYYVSSGSGRDFQPMNINFGIIASPENKIKGGKKAKYAFVANRALETIKELRGKI